MAKTKQKRIRAEGVALCVLKVKLPEPEKQTYEGHAKERKYPSLASWVRRAMKLQHAREAECRFDVPPPVIPMAEKEAFKKAIVKKG